MSDDFYDDEQPQGESEHLYQLTDRDWSIIAATTKLLRLILQQPAIHPRKLEVVARMLRVLYALPKVSEALCHRIDCRGPQRKFEDRKIFHWWEIKIDEQQITILSGGYLDRPSTGGDSFLCMQWNAWPGFSAELDDHLDALQLIDDAQPFESEVAELVASGSIENINVEGDSDDGYDWDDEEDELDEIASEIPIVPAGNSEQQLESIADVSKGREVGIFTVPTPPQCGLCGRSFRTRKYAVDGGVRGIDAWFYLCSVCFLERGNGLGYGVGQLYARQPDGRWLLVGGFPPPDLCPS